LAACRADNVHCIAAARDVFQTCRSGCDDEVQAVRRACATEPESEACVAARDALRMCLEPCRHGVGEALERCGNASTACAAACDANPTAE